MNHHAAKTFSSEESLLSVSYKSPSLVSNAPNPLPESIITTDSNFIITGISANTETFCNIPSKEVIGKNLFEVAPFEIKGSTLGEAIALLFNKGYWTGQIVYHRNNCQDVYFETTVTLVHDEQSRVKNILFINKHISESIHHAQDLALAEHKYQTLIETLSDGVLLINIDGTIGAANKRATEILDVTEEQLLHKNNGVSAWKAFKEDNTPATMYDYPAFITLTTGLPQLDVVMGIDQKDGKRKWLSINSKALFKEGKNTPYAVVVSFSDITAIKATNEKLAESEILFRTFMTNSPTLGWIYDEDGNYIYGNNLFKETIGLTDGDIGKNIRQISTHTVAETILLKNRLAIEKQEPVISEDELIDKDGKQRYFLAYWFMLPSGNGKKKLISGHAIDITEIKNTRKQVELMNERFEHVLKATSEAIWDLDLTTSSIYRSENFATITGYPMNEIQGLDWWMNKIHPDDQYRVQQKFYLHLQTSETLWQDEYRFLCADNNYHDLLDRGFTICENGKPIRLVGAIQDMTEQKRLEAQLLKEQVYKQKSINLATIEAQEKERSIISRELHDNVNQLLMSAKLHIGVAKSNKDNQDEFLTKASDYLLLAVEEIRTLSKQLNSSVLSTVGLQKSIDDITRNLRDINNIEVEKEIDECIVDLLTPEQQLMVYRIVQEQSNNIIKYSQATKAFIILREKNEMVQLLISDNGKGFEKTEESMKGIGFINITSRVDAYNGEVKIISSPENGCLLDVTFPFMDIE